MASRVLSAGYTPRVFPKATYSTTGSALSFADATGKVRRSAHLAIYVYAGTALIAFDGLASGGNELELAAGASFNFPVETTAIHVKASVATTSVGVVVGLYPGRSGSAAAAGPAPEEAAVYCRNRPSTGAPADR